MKEVRQVSDAELDVYDMNDIRYREIVTIMQILFACGHFAIVRSRKMDCIWL